MNNKKITFIGYASGIAAGDPGTGDGPVVLSKSQLSDELERKGIHSHWQNLLFPLSDKRKLPVVAELSIRLAQRTYELVKQQQLFTVFGGDHSCGIGTWSGAAYAMREQGPLGLIWIDAHMDSHTMETSPSGNIHGMPVAALLGHGAAQLTEILTEQAKIQAQHLCLIGIRSYEAGEAELLKRLGVRVYYMDEVLQRGISVVLQEARNIARQGTAAYGISIDLDSIDPEDAPAVGTMEPNGIRAASLCEALTMFRHDPQLLGLEIAEFNPHHDRDKCTEKVIRDLLIAIFSS